MSENLRDAIGVILEAGFQIESDAFKTLVQFGRAETLRPLIDEVLKVAGSVEPRPLFISSDLVLKAVEKLELTGNRQAEAGTSADRPRGPTPPPQCLRHPIGRRPQRWAGSAPSARRPGGAR